MTFQTVFPPFCTSGCHLALRLETVKQLKLYPARIGCTVWQKTWKSFDLTSIGISPLTMPLIPFHSIVLPHLSKSGSRISSYTPWIVFEVNFLHLLFFFSLSFFSFLFLFFEFQWATDAHMFFGMPTILVSRLVQLNSITDLLCL